MVGTYHDDDDDDGDGDGDNDCDVDGVDNGDGDGDSGGDGDGDADADDAADDDDDDDGDDDGDRSSGIDMHHFIGPLPWQTCFAFWGGPIFELLLWVVAYNLALCKKLICVMIPSARAFLNLTQHFAHEV